MTHSRSLNVIPLFYGLLGELILSYIQSTLLFHHHQVVFSSYGPLGELILSYIQSTLLFHHHQVVFSSYGPL